MAECIPEISFLIMQSKTAALLDTAFLRMQMRGAVYDVYVFSRTYIYISSLLLRFMPHWTSFKRLIHTECFHSRLQVGLINYLCTSR